RDRFSLLLDTAPVPLVLAEFENGTPVVKQPNRLFKETFGFTGLELGGSSLDKFIVGDSTSPQSREINDKLRRGERVHREVRRKTADDDERVFLLNAAPLTGERDEALMTYIDITDRKRAEDDLKQKTDELERFANVVSHDLRNPLNVAEGHLDMLAEDCESQHVDPIRNALTRMRELIENILMLARQGRAVDEMVPVSLATCTADSWETVDTAAATVRTESSRTIRADPSRLRQLFGNLIRNAIEHAGEDVTITVGDLEDGFFIQDDGPGIPEANRADVFEAGYTSTKNGTGFGLSIVREIVDAHGWSIDVTDAPGGGARFEITGVETAS
ncbi:MAG: PAS domain-containing sensor histidine kinase, partial [archaeon]